MILGFLCYNPTFQYASFEQDVMLTFKAFDANIGAQPEYTPFVAATRMFFLEMYHIANLYPHNLHYIVPSGCSVDRVDR